MLLGVFSKVVFTCSEEFLLSFDERSQSMAYRHARHDVIGQLPAYEKVGPDSRSVRMNIKLLSAYNSPPEIYLSMLSEIMNTGDAYPLILGAKYYGRFILNSVEVREKFFDSNGLCISADASIVLTCISDYTLSDLIDDVSSAAGDIAGAAGDFLT